MIGRRRRMRCAYMVKEKLVRVNIFPKAEYAIVMSKGKTQVPTLQSLSDAASRKWRRKRVVGDRYGSPGRAKTTTRAAGIEEINRNQRCIVTLEDPARVRASAQEGTLNQGAGPDFEASEWPAFRVAAGAEGHSRR